MSLNNFRKFSVGLALAVALSSFAMAQDTTTKTTTTTTSTKTEVVQNPDGTYTVIEYPVGKEVTVTLTPNNLQGAAGTARVMRSADGTKIWLDLTGMPADSKGFYAYAVDPKGTPTLLGPVMIQNGVAKAEFSTPMNQFMIVLSPNEGVTAFSNETPITFRSAVPTGYAVVPLAVTSSSGNKQVAGATEVSSTYEVPMLNVPSFNKTSEIRINFGGELAGLKGKAYIEPTKDNLTKVKMRFDEMDKAPKGKRFVLWAASPDGKFTKLGQVVNNGRGEREEGEIRSETGLKDFGLFITVEEADVNQPTSKTYSVFTVNP